MADISVDLEVNTSDGLRQIIINLAKETKDDGKADWSMTFVLNEKKKADDKDFKKIVGLTVKIKPKHNAKAQDTADNGLSPKQESQAEFAASSAKLLKEKKISKVSADAELQKVISVR